MIIPNLKNTLCNFPSYWFKNSKLKNMQPSQRLEKHNINLCQLYRGHKVKITFPIIEPGYKNQ